MAKNQTSAIKVQTSESSGTINKLFAAIKDRIPFGYEDETGFHYETEPISSLREQSSEK